MFLLIITIKQNKQSTISSHFLTFLSSPISLFLFLCLFGYSFGFLQPNLPRTNFSIKKQLGLFVVPDIKMLFTSSALVILAYSASVLAAPAGPSTTASAAPPASTGLSLTQKLFIADT